MKIMLFITIIEFIVIALYIVENKQLKKKQHSMHLSYWRQVRRADSLESENCRLRLEKQDTDKQIAALKTILFGITFQMQKRDNAEIKQLKERGQDG